MARNAHVRYLEVSQQNYTEQASSYACVTISLYTSMFLAYSKEPTMQGALTWFAFAAKQWEDAVKVKNALRQCEMVDIAYNRYAYVKNLLEQSENYTGLSIKGKTDNEELDGYTVYGSVLAVMKEVGRRAMLLPLHHSIVFTFTRGLFTLGGVVRSLGEGMGVVIHFIDSHSRILPFAPPPSGHPYGSGVWITADTVEQASEAIEAIYPPFDPEEPVEENEVERLHKSLDTVPKDMSKAARRNAGEARLIHPGQFELRTFLPRYATPAEASAAAAKLHTA